MVVEGVSQQLQFNDYYGRFITSFICACRDLNLMLLLCAVIKFRAKLKATQLANFSFMSRHIIVCRDISKLWEDKLSSGCNIRHLMTLLSCRDLNTLLKELLLSRPKCSVATSISFTTELLVMTSPLFFLQY